MSQTPFPEEGMSPGDQVDVDLEIITSQTYVPEQERSQRGRLDIGPGGVIPDSPGNRELLEQIERTPALTPSELYRLAVSYQHVLANSGLGNRLAFIGLSSIFEHPSIQQLLKAPAHSFAEAARSIERDSCPWYCNLFPGADGCQNCNVHIARTTGKRVEYAGLELLIEITQVEDAKTYVILGVSPSKLDLR